MSETTWSPEQIKALIEASRESNQLLKDFLGFFSQSMWIQKVTLTESPQILNLDGYRHIGIWVPNSYLPLSVNIGMPGIESTRLTLVTGLNALPSVDGMMISGTQGTPINIIRSNQPLVYANPPLGPLPSPGEVLLIGPNAGISLAAGTSYQSPKYNPLGNRMVGYFTDISGFVSSSGLASSSLNAYSSLLASESSAYVTGGSAVNYNISSWTDMSAILTKAYNVTVSAPSANTVTLTINGISLGIG